MKTLIRTICFLAAAACAVQASLAADRTVRPPRGAIVLFGGKDTNGFEGAGSDKTVHWILRDGAMVVQGGNIVSKQLFGDQQLHIEFMPPLMEGATGQGRGNSGVYLQGQYEIQVLDSFNNPTYKAGSCGSIYGQKEPDRNMARPPLQWQTYDITFRAPRFDKDGKKRENPRVTVIWNGVKVHDDVEITIGPTTSSLGGPEVAQGPLLLQDHGCAVSYRNVWVKPLKLK